MVRLTAAPIYACLLLVVLQVSQPAIGADLRIQKIWSLEVDEDLVRIRTNSFPDLIEAEKGVNPLFPVGSMVVKRFNPVPLDRREEVGKLAFMTSSILEFDRRGDLVSTSEYWPAERVPAGDGGSRIVLSVDDPTKSLAREDGLVPVMFTGEVTSTLGTKQGDLLISTADAVYRLDAESAATTRLCSGKLEDHDLSDDLWLLITVDAEDIRTVRIHGTQGKERYARRLEPGQVASMPFIYPGGEDALFDIYRESDKSYVETVHVDLRQGIRESSVRFPAGTRYMARSGSIGVVHDLERRIQVFDTSDPDAPVRLDDRTCEGYVYAVAVSPDGCVIALQEVVDVPSSNDRMKYLDVIDFGNPDRTVHRVNDQEMGMGLRFVDDRWLVVGDQVHGPPYHVHLVPTEVVNIYLVR